MYGPFLEAKTDTTQNILSESYRKQVQKRKEEHCTLSWKEFYIPKQKKP